MQKKRFIDPTLLEEKLRSSSVDLQTNKGRVLSVHDDIVHISGMYSVALNEKVTFPDGSQGIILELNRDKVVAVLLNKASNISSGDLVLSAGGSVQVPVGYEIVGRMLDPLGNILDTAGAITYSNYSTIYRDAPSTMDRKSISTPLLTGIKSIDTLIPIGKGQRELIIGNRKSGKTQIALDTIINQKGKNVFCIYVAIGQSKTKILDIYNKLSKSNAMEYTTIIFSSPSDTAAMQYIAPLSACAMAEYLRDDGNDVLIIYDDLTKHAWAYRQISLLLKRPASREAYPGDMFSVHADLLERASNVTSEYIERITKVPGKTGSITALPIIETQLDDISSYIATNIISITDGQIFLGSELFNTDCKPAIDTSKSVSRVGGAAQYSILRELSTGLRLSIAQYKELEAFAKLESSVDKDTQKMLNRGIKSIAILQQPAYAPNTYSQTCLPLYALNSGFLDSVHKQQIPQFLKAVNDYLSRDPEIENKLLTAKTVNDVKDNFDRILEEVLTLL